MQTESFLASQSPRAREVTLFYVDVSGFTEMTERLGDGAAFERMRGYLGSLRAAAADRGGREVEVRGDACLLAFDSPEACLACAVAVQRRLAEQRRADPAHAIRVRIGLHTGRPIMHETGFFGRDVIVAARLCDVCPTNAILASHAFLRRLRDVSRAGRERRVRLKGLPRLERVARIYWGAKEEPRRALGGRLDRIASRCLGRLREIVMLRATS
jgi:class 3 adenylate cyclase